MARSTYTLLYLLLVVAVSKWIMCCHAASLTASARTEQQIENLLDISTQFQVHKCAHLAKNAVDDSDSNSILRMNHKIQPLSDVSSILTAADINEFAYNETNFGPYEFGSYRKRLESYSYRVVFPRTGSEEECIPVVVMLHPSQVRELSPDTGICHAESQKS